MWGHSVQFWQSIGDWLLVVALILGALTVISSFASSLISGQTLKRFQTDADQRIAEAEARAAEANQKAERERLERLKLEARFAPRRLNAGQQRAIATALNSFSGRNVMVKSYALDVEAAILGKQIIETLKSANIQVSDKILSVSSLGSVALAPIIHDGHRI